MGFFNICPRNKRYLDFAIKAIPLKVVQKNGIDYTPDFSVQKTDLNGGYKHFKVNSGRADTFKVSVIIHKKDKVKGQLIGEAFKLPKNVVNNIRTPIVHTADGDYEVLEYASDKMLLDYYETWSVRELLNYFMRHLTPLMITSDIIGVNDKQLWIITSNKSRKQDYLNYTVWELEFTRYQKVKYGSFKKTTKGVQKALKNLKKSKKSSKAATKTKLKAALKKCKPKVLVYSKKKKTVKCVKTLQKFLNNNLGTKLVADGWYGNETVKAVKKFQKKYSKKYGLKETGNVNTKTYNVMIGKAKPVTNSKVTAKTTSNKPKKDKLGIKIVKQDMSGFVK